MEDDETFAELEQEKNDYYSTLKKKQKLIILLVGNEIERIQTWNNPQNLPEYAIKEASKYSTKSIPLRKIKKFLEFSWKIFPSLAINIAHRFPNSEIRSKLETMVKKKMFVCLLIINLIFYLLLKGFGRCQQGD